MRSITKNGVRIDDTFAEAFPMRGTALIITGPNKRWARQAAVTMTGFATSVIGCGCEASIDGEVEARDTPVGRPGVRVIIFARSSNELQTKLVNRVGQCVLTSPGSACFADLAAPDVLKIGDLLRYFGDGWQISKKFGGQHFWRIPVMDGEFLCEATTGLTKGAVGGGNLLICGADFDKTLRAAEAAIEAMQEVRDAIMP
ncbi:MAG: formylmethanofuran--tetrahydromethanopterin N-formyltransferase, partial [Methylovirgula sp.]